MRLPPLLLAVLLPLALGCAVVAVLADGAGGRASSTTAAPVTGAAPSRTVALTVLRSWDRRRAAAWAEGDPDALARLYLPASAAGRRDVAMLRRWTARGLTVGGLRMQVVGARVRWEEPDRLVVEVTDRLAGGTARGAGVRVPLPSDRLSTRLLTFRRVGEEWRIGAIRPVG